MSKHVTEWLQAYLDGELRSNQFQQVEAHLAECQECQAERESLQRLSAWLQEVPMPEFTSPEQFAAQVNLRLPHEQTVLSGKNILAIGWWLVPIGLLATWIFISTSVLVSTMVSAANHLGLLASVSNWMVFGSSSDVYWSVTLGQFGVLSGNSLNWAEATEVFTRTSLPLFSVHASIALLYLSWIAIWWTRHTRQGHGRPLEG